MGQSDFRAGCLTEVIGPFCNVPDPKTEVNGPNWSRQLYNTEVIGPLSMIAIALYKKTGTWRVKESISWKYEQSSL